MIRILWVASYRLSVRSSSGPFSETSMNLSVVYRQKKSFRLMAGILFLRFDFLVGGIETKGRRGAWRQSVSEHRKAPAQLKAVRTQEKRALFSNAVYYDDFRILGQSLSALESGFFEKPRRRIEKHSVTSLHPQ